jgi:septum formation protein
VTGPGIRFVLASASPARLATLRRAGVEPEVIVSDVDEDAHTAETPEQLAQQLAELKAAAVATRLAGEALVLGCDSVLEFDGEPLGKPGEVAVARQRWRRMRGRAGVLHTGHCLYERGTGATATATVSTTVRFADVDDDEIELYLSTGEPFNVAGAFTIDGYAGWFVEGVVGDPHNVVGVSLPALRAMLRELGHGLRDIGYPAS